MKNFSFDEFLQSHGVNIATYSIPGVTDIEKVTQGRMRDSVRAWLFSLIEGVDSKQFFSTDKNFWDLCFLISFHPDQRDKTSMPIDFFNVKRKFNSDGTPSPEIHIFYENLSSNDASWVKCANSLAGKLPKNQKLHSLFASLRMSIKEQIQDYKASQQLPNGLFKCEKTGQEFSSSEVDVDHHYPQFKELAHEWIKINGGIYAIETESAGLGQGNILKEPYLSSWRKYHREKANLRILHASKNRSRKRAKVDSSELFQKPL